MIIDNRENLQRYAPLHPLFEPAFGFLLREDLANLPPGRNEISEEHGLFAVVANKSGIDETPLRLEAHRKYIDIQYVLSGEHEIGWLPLNECKAAVAPYEADRDIIFFEDAPRFSIALPRGHFAVLFPEDAHAPAAVDGMIHKVVVKVPV